MAAQRASAQRPPVRSRTVAQGVDRPDCNKVLKFEGPVARAALTRPDVTSQWWCAEFAPRLVDPCGRGGTRPTRGTRDRVCRAVLAHGPVTASDLAERLGLTPAAVRRHLDALAGRRPRRRRERRRSPVRPPQAGAGPARRYVATDAGSCADVHRVRRPRAAALRFLGESGREAGRAPLRRAARGATSSAATGPTSRPSGTTSRAAPRRSPTALTADGYAATVRPAAPGARSGHPALPGALPGRSTWPREFPELCEAETEAFSRLLGVHVQRLATLAHGEHVCTTHVPTGAAPRTPTSVRPPVTHGRHVR